MIKITLMEDGFSPVLGWDGIMDALLRSPGRWHRLDVGNLKIGTIRNGIYRTAQKHGVKAQISSRADEIYVRVRSK